MSDESKSAGHAFISYVREDAEAADRLQQALEDAGVRVWRDTTDLWPGQDWRSRIRRAITDDALAFIVCFSDKSIYREKSYQNEELALAIDQLRLRHPDDPWLIPVRLDDCVIQDREIGGGRWLSSIQWVDLFGEHEGDGVLRLVAAVKRILGQFPAGGASAARDPFAEDLDLHRRDCIARCPTLASGEPVLYGRASERAQITAIAFAGKRFCWVRAPMSAGKTAVAAWLAFAPPADTVALACFVSPTTDGDQFLDLLIRRLRALLRRRSVPSAALSERPILLATLLEEAGDQFAETGRHLLVVVDGLDEDPQASGVAPIARLLPRMLPEHVHLVVFSRPNPGPLALDHPLREASACYDLPPAEEALVEMERAQEELDRVAHESSSIAAQALTMLAVAGPLTDADLVDLLKPRMAREVALAFSGPLRRLTYGVEAGGRQSYSIGHIALRQAWLSGLGSRAVESAMRQIDNWADEHGDRGWPASTPPYCLDGYVDMLVRRGEATRLAAIALDGRRRSRLLADTGSRVADAMVLAKALRAVSMMAAPDMGLATRLALASLIVRNSLEEAARPEMVAFDVRRGEVRKAIDTVMALSPEADYWHSTCVELVAALYLTDHDDAADALIQRFRSEHDRELASSVASRVAADRPALAIRLAAGNPGILAGIASALAAHDDLADLAIGTVLGNPEEQLAVARVLAPRQPQAALRAVEDFRGYWEWSSSSKVNRLRSFARVEAARAMKSADASPDVLAEELSGSDRDAAVIAMGMILAEQGRGAELDNMLGGHDAIASALARFAVGEGTTRAVDQVIDPWKYWGTSDLDVLQRFDLVHASSPPVVRADYARLLRSAQGFGSERRAEAALVILTQLIIIDDLRDDDAELLAHRFGSGPIPVHEARGAAARRIALIEPRRAAVLALDSGPNSTWVLLDVLRDIAACDLRLAVELTDLVEPELSGTRSVILGGIGALVDPGDSELIEELNRRITPPENSSLARHALGDAALRVSALLPDGDERGRRLRDLFAPGADSASGRVDLVELAIDIAREGNAEIAVLAMKAAAEKQDADSVRMVDGWIRLVGHLPPELASQVLVQEAPAIWHHEFDKAICALASLDAVAAIRQLVDERSYSARMFATVLRPLPLTFRIFVPFREV